MEFHIVPGQNHGSVALNQPRPCAVAVFGAANPGYWRLQGSDRVVKISRLFNPCKLTADNTIIDCGTSYINLAGRVSVYKVLPLGMAGSCTIPHHTAYRRQCRCMHASQLEEWRNMSCVWLVGTPQPRLSTGMKGHSRWYFSCIVANTHIWIHRTMECSQLIALIQGEVLLLLEYHTFRPDNSPRSLADRK